jgi:hypothetical protein
MAYQKKTENILSGSKNVLAPADQLPGNDALLLKNFRANTVGALESRKGSVVQLASTTGWPTSICRVDAASPRRYFGAGGSLYRNGTVVSAAFGTTTPIAMVSYQNYAFATTDTLQAKDDGTSLFPWQVAGPTAAISAATATPTGAGLTGTYVYFMTYSCADGSESAYGPSRTISLTAQAADLSSFPAYSPPAGLANPVTLLNIYRGGGSQTSTVLIASFPPSTTTYQDEVSDITAQQNGTVIQTVLYSPPPPAYGVAGPYFDRLLMFGSAAHPNRLWWSEGLRPYAWPGALTDNGNHIDFGEEGEWILAVTVYSTHITIYKEKSIWRIYGDPGTDAAVAERVSSAYGINGRNAVVHATGVDYFGCPEGIFRWNGESGSKTSGKVTPIFLGEFADLITANLAAPMETTSASLMALGYRRGQLYVSYPQQGQTGTIVNNWTLVYDPITTNWTDYDAGFSVFVDEGHGDFLTGYAGGLLKLEDGLTDHGAIINLDYHGQFSDQGEPENDKIYNDLTFDVNTNGAVVSVHASIDNGNTIFNLGFLTCLVRTTFVFPYGADGLGLRGKNHAIRITGFLSTGSTTPTDSPVFLYKATLHYIPQPRYSRTFDSDVSDLGMRDVKFCDFLELDVDISGAGTVTWVLSSDRPSATGTNPTLAQRATGTFTKGTLTGRRPLRFPFTECEGQLFRLTISGDATTLFLLYSARLRVRPIGLYLDGANGESFKTKEIGISI